LENGILLLVPKIHPASPLSKKDACNIFNFSHDTSLSSPGQKQSKTANKYLD